MGLKKSGFAIVGVSIAIGLVFIGGIKIADTVEASTRVDYGMVPCGIQQTTEIKELSKPTRLRSFVLTCGGNPEPVRSWSDYRVTFADATIVFQPGDLLECRMVESGTFGFIRPHEQYSYYGCKLTTPDKFLKNP